MRRPSRPWLSTSSSIGVLAAVAAAQAGCSDARRSDYGVGVGSEVVTAESALVVVNRAGESSVRAYVRGERIERVDGAEMIAFLFEVGLEAMGLAPGPVALAGSEDEDPRFFPHAHLALRLLDDQWTPIDASDAATTELQDRLKLPALEEIFCRQRDLCPSVGNHGAGCASCKTTPFKLERASAPRVVDDWSIEDTISLGAERCLAARASSSSPLIPVLYAANDLRAAIEAVNANPPPEGHQAILELGGSSTAPAIVTLRGSVDLPPRTIVRGDCLVEIVGSFSARNAVFEHLTLRGSITASVGSVRFRHVRFLPREGYPLPIDGDTDTDTDTERGVAHAAAGASLTIEESSFTGMPAGVSLASSATATITNTVFSSIRGVALRFGPDTRATLERVIVRNAKRGMVALDAASLRGRWVALESIEDVAIQVSAPRAAVSLEALTVASALKAIDVAAAATFTLDRARLDRVYLGIRAAADEQQLSDLIMDGVPWPMVLDGGDTQVARFALYGPEVGIERHTAQCDSALELLDGHVKDATDKAISISCGRLRGDRLVLTDNAYGLIAARSDVQLSHLWIEGLVQDAQGLLLDDASRLSLDSFRIEGMAVGLMLRNVAPAGALKIRRGIWKWNRTAMRVLDRDALEEGTVGEMRFEGNGKVLSLR